MTRPIHILLVEDNPGDVLLAREALAESATDYTVSVVIDGEEALHRLRRSAPTANFPDLVLLDVQLPGMSGHDVLRAIKGDFELGPLPVVMLSTSVADGDVRESYRRHANCYIAKPTGLDDYVDTIHAIEEFWFSTVRLPTRSR
jgi:CheY-like chemotaxis protein